MSLSTTAPHESSAEGVAKPAERPAGRRTHRGTVADGVWILAATALFVLFQVVALL